MVYCCVPNCNNKDGFAFPKDKVTKSKWIVSIRREKPGNEKGLWQPNAKSAVCKDHFTWKT